MNNKRIIASFLAILISISSFFNVVFAQTDPNVNVDKKLSEEKTLLELGGKEIKENENGEIIVNFKDIKDGNGVLKYIGSKNVPKGKYGIWVETGVSNFEAILLEEYEGYDYDYDEDTNKDTKCTSVIFQKKVWDTEIVYGISDDEFEEYIEPQNVIKKVKIKIVTDDPSYVDVSGLEKLIIKGKKYLNERQYYKEEYIKKLQDTIKESESLLEKENKNIGKEEINKQIGILTPIVENPEKKEFNKTELDKILKKAQTLNKENYTKGSYKKVEFYIDYIKSKDDKFQNQLEVDICAQELKKVVDGLIDISKLKEIIVKAEKLEKGSLSDDSWTNFQNALKEAKEVYKNKVSSRKDVDNALKNLNSTMSVLSNMDKSALKIAIEKVENLHEDEFKPESLAGKQKILSYVKSVYNNSDAKQEQIDQAVKNIENWLDKLEKKYVVYYETIDRRRIDLDGSNSIELDSSQGGGKFCLQGKPELKDENEIYWVSDHDKRETVALTNMKDGKLYLKGIGETSIQLKFTNGINYNNDPAIVTINLKVKDIPKIEDIKVYVNDKEVSDKISINGKQNVTLGIKAKFECKNDYIGVDRATFEYYTLNERNDKNANGDRGDKNSIIHLYNYNTDVTGIIISEMVGITTIVINFPRDGIKKQIPVEVKHVPIEEICFDIPKEFEYEELGFAPGSNNGIYLRNVLEIKPKNATYKGEVALKFSDESIAFRERKYGDYIKPKKDGTVDITAYLDADGKHFEVARKVTFYGKKKAVKNIQTTNDKVEVKIDEILPIGIETIPKDASNQEFEYKVSKEGIVDIIGNSVKGLKEGTVEIEAKSKDKNCKNTVKVTVSVLPKSKLRDVKGEVKNTIKEVVPSIQKDRYNFSDEWNILGLARNDESLISKEQKNTYINSIIEFIKKENKLSVKGKPTDIEKVVIALTAMGIDVGKVNEGDLLKSIYENHNLVNGLNESAYALIALDSLNYNIPNNAMWTRNKLIEEVKRYQNPNGGFGLFDNKNTSIDMTAIALQALSTYKDREDVKPVIEKALDYLRKNQTEYGGFKDSGKENAESAAQVLVALTSLGIDPLDPSSKFGNENYNVVTNILSYRNNEDGKFNHWKQDDSSNQMSTIQSYYALVSYLRLVERRSKFYDMRDEKEAIVIRGFTPVKDMEVDFSTNKQDVLAKLPKKITLNLSNDSKEYIKVTWISKEYDGNKSGEYIFVGSYELPKRITGDKPEVNIKVKVKEEQKLGVDKTELEEIINKAEKIDIEGKTEKSIKTLNESISKSKEILSKRELTQKEVDNAVKIVEMAIKNLEGKKDSGNKPEESKKIKVEKISLDKRLIEVKKEEAIKLIATITPDNTTNKNVIWTSSNDEIATIDNEGNVRALKAGEVVIKVATEDGQKFAECKVVVKAEKEVDPNSDKKEIQIKTLTIDKEFKLGSDAKVTIKATNKTKENKDAALIVGVFNKDGQLVNYGAVEQNIKADEDVKLTVNLSLQKEGEYTVKAFVWDSLDKMNSISKVIEIPVKQLVDNKF
ncbi:Ig-like domain-containing protein [Clostridium tetani]|uniref:Ig-like domain-containing protein n=1 Tax=Clostridium tetani TaxID=1513 RepID=UPI0003C0D3E3|nr:Ig-like domain-containing protein [Clostridium tetani]CDI48806.1 surface/cell-adhesion protein [Clostridium tetani 12124569]